MPQTGVAHSAASHKYSNGQYIGKLMLGTAAGLATAWAANTVVRQRRHAAKPAAEGTSAAIPGTHGLRKASMADTLATFVDVILPNLAKGVILRRPRMVALAAWLDLDRRAVRRMQVLRDKYWPGPLMLCMPFRSQALVLNEAHVRRILQGTPEPFTSASTEKQAALAHFQPKGVLISNEPERKIRRRINDEALDAHRQVHRMADGFLDVVNEETARLIESVRDRAELTWDDFAPAWFRIVRRIVLGDSAAEDNELTDMLAALRADANWAFLKPKRTGLQERFFHRLQEYVVQAEPGSLASLVAAMNVANNNATHQMPQWLFAFDAAGMATFRALALLAAHEEVMARAREEVRAHPADARQDLPVLRATVLESTRLWPPTPVILRQSTRDTGWESGSMPAKTGLLIYLPFFHRDDKQLPFADRFAPDVWLEEGEAGKWPLVPFSDGPAFCSGQNLVLLLSSAMLAALLDGRECRLDSLRRLNPVQPMPGTLNPYSLRFTLEEPEGAGAAAAK